MERSLSAGFSLILLIILPTAHAISAAEPSGAIRHDNLAAVQAGILVAFRFIDTHRLPRNNGKERGIDSEMVV